jgi:hypothetical protein
MANPEQKSGKKENKNFQPAANTFPHGVAFFTGAAPEGLPGDSILRDHRSSSHFFYFLSKAAQFAFVHELPYSFSGDGLDHFLPILTPGILRADAIFFQHLAWTAISSALSDFPTAEVYVTFPFLAHHGSERLTLDPVCATAMQDDIMLSGAFEAVWPNLGHLDDGETLRVKPTAEGDIYQLDIINITNNFAFARITLVVNQMPHNDQEELPVFHPSLLGAADDWFLAAVDQRSTKTSDASLPSHLHLMPDGACFELCQALSIFVSQMPITDLLFEAAMRHCRDQFGSLTDLQYHKQYSLCFDHYLHLNKKTESHSWMIQAFNKADSIFNEKRRHLREMWGGLLLAVPPYVAVIMISLVGAFVLLSFIVAAWFSYKGGGANGYHRVLTMPFLEELARSAVDLGPSSWPFDVLWVISHAWSASWWGMIGPILYLVCLYKFRFSRFIPRLIFHVSWNALFVWLLPIGFAYISATVLQWPQRWGPVTERSFFIHWFLSMWPAYQNALCFFQNRQDLRDLAIHFGWSSIECASSLSPVLAAVALLQWTLRRILGARNVKEACLCSRFKLRGRRKMKVNHAVLTTCGYDLSCHESYIHRIGPALPHHLPFCPSPCNQNLLTAITKRLMPEADLSPVVTDREIDEILPPAIKIEWAWDDFIRGKPAKLIRRAQHGLLEMNKRGGRCVDHQYYPPADIQRDATMFVKRELYNYLIDLDKPMKTRVIINCSDEILAYLGPYMWSLEQILHHLPGLVKHLNPDSLSPLVKEIKLLAEMCNQSLSSADQKAYDCHQTTEHLKIQHRLYARLGLPQPVCDFLSTYDTVWTARAYETVHGRRRQTLKFRSNQGMRKTGDPQTSVGNNLYHWFMMRLMALRLTGDAKNLHCIINGDDFLGFFKGVDFNLIVKSLRLCGLETEVGEAMEFCGGHFMGSECVYIRDPTRALAKIGWTHGKPVAGLFKATLICQSYTSSHNPILSALIARCLRLCDKSVYRLTQRQKEDENYWLANLGIDLDQACPQFSTVVPLDVRLDYSRIHGISPALQIHVEQLISRMELEDDLPEIIGLLL